MAAKKEIVSALPLKESDASESGLFGVPKWALACALGGAVLLGVAAYYVFSAPDDDGPKKSGSKKKPAKGTTDAKSAKKNVTVQDLTEEDGEEMPTDPFQRAIASKNKGNKYFRGGRYELAIKCYSEAIEACPKSKATDLSTFYQNRAAAREQLEQCEAVLSDCNEAIRLNNRYVKALERRARVQRQIVAKEGGGEKPSQDVVDRLRMAMEDMTAVCFLEGFQKQEHLLLVDGILNELGRSEAKLVFSKRKPSLTSKHFIRQYFMSFEDDPVMNGLKELDESPVNGDSDLSSYERTLIALKRENFQEAMEACNDAIRELSEEEEEEEDKLVRARSIRASFYILTKQQDLAMEELSWIVENESADPKIRANALIKRASLFIQRCHDPRQDAALSFGDFDRATRVDPDNSDVYHHRGQVHLLTEQTEKAIADFEKAVSLNPTYPIARVQKLFTEYKAATERSDQVGVKNVINSFEEAIATFPDCVECYSLYAQVLRDQQQFDKADEYYAKAVEVDPTNGNLMVHRALVALQSRGDVERARELIRKALEIDDKCEFAYETLGTVEVQSGNLKPAVELFEKAIPLANTELEMGHICGLRSAAVAQSAVSERLGIQLPSMMMG